MKTPAQIKQIVARTKLRATERDGFAAYSPYLKIAYSDVYDHKPAMKAVLKEIAFCTVANDVPSERPWGRQNVEYAGWCFLSMETLGRRCGCGKRYVAECLEAFEADGYLEIREYRDAHGVPHKEYRVISDKLQPWSELRTSAEQPGNAKQTKAHSRKA
jgi:hypothetical protein